MEKAQLARPEEQKVKLPMKKVKDASSDSDRAQDFAKPVKHHERLIGRQTLVFKKFKQNIMRSSVDNSLQKLNMMIMQRDNLQELNLSQCQIGDSGFKVVLHGIHDVRHSELLQLNLARNGLTNASIEYINETFLNFR